LARYPLGNNRFIIASTFKGSVYVHVRQFEKRENSEILYPTKIGISLTPSRFAVLCSMKGEIDEAVQQRHQGQTTTLKAHLGGGVYCTLMGKYDLVNIRKYFVPEGKEEEIPTRYGVALKLNEWDNLSAAMDDIRQASEDLLTAQPCYMATDHSNQLGFLQCRECTPFPNKDLFSYFNF
jgi:Transcriptional Coactivator p15 (PC4)